jgi:endonuclease III
MLRDVDALRMFGVSDTLVAITGVVACDTLVAITGVGAIMADVVLGIVCPLSRSFK